MRLAELTVSGSYTESDPESGHIQGITMVLPSGQPQRNATVAHLYDAKYAVADMLATAVIRYVPTPVREAPFVSLMVSGASICHRRSWTGTPAGKQSRRRPAIAILIAYSCGMPAALRELQL